MRILCSQHKYIIYPGSVRLRRVVVALLTGNLSTLSLRYSPTFLFSSIFSPLPWNISTILAGYVLTLLPGYLE